MKENSYRNHNRKDANKYNQTNKIYGHQKFNKNSYPIKNTKNHSYKIDKKYISQIGIQVNIRADNYQCKLQVNGPSWGQIDNKDRKFIQKLQWEIAMIIVIR